MRNIIRKSVSIPIQEEKIDYAEMPIIEAGDYARRIKKLWDIVGKRFTHCIFYGDREHFSNIEYFTGYDPRFEEALLILSPDEKPVILVGDEGCVYATKIPFDIEIITFPPFSLPNQPCNNHTSLEEILRNTGISGDSRLGLAGWKLFDGNAYADPEKQFDFPFFIMQAINNVCEIGNITNINSVMIGENGIRLELEAKELVMAEIAGTKSSHATYRVLTGLKEGISELEASALLCIDGSPTNVHPNINFGSNYLFALASPEAWKRLEYGDIVGVGMAYRRSLCHKVSYFVRDKTGLKDGAEEIYDRYFTALTAWYESIRIGVSGGYVHDRVLEVVGSFKEFGIALNAGHLIHTEEWTSSPFFEGSRHLIKSGMMIQCDFTASPPDTGVSVHSEDGIIIADDKMREKISLIAPNSYRRMLNRQKFMRDTLGIKIADEVLPTSDIPAIVFPYLCDLSMVLSNI